MKKKIVKKRNQKPRNSHTLTLHFDTKTGVENFMAGLIDGGADQQGGYYSNRWGKDWVYLIPGSDACPACEFDCLQEHDDGNFITTSCTNCDFSSTEECNV